MSKRSFDQFNSLDVNHVTNHSSFSLVNRLTADAYRYDDYKYVSVHRHQLFIRQHSMPNMDVRHMFAATSLMLRMCRRLSAAMSFVWADITLPTSKTTN